MEQTLNIKQRGQNTDITIDSETCFSLTYFKETLKLLRKADDNIILRLNRIDTSDSEACKDLFKQLSSAYKSRDDTIDYCYKLVNEQINSKKRVIEGEPNNSQLQATLYSEEAKLRWMKNERNVEEIIRDRSLKVFRERCHGNNITPS